MFYGLVKGSNQSRDNGAVVSALFRIVAITGWNGDPVALKSRKHQFRRCMLLRAWRRCPAVVTRFRS